MSRKLAEILKDPSFIVTTIFEIKNSLEAEFPSGALNPFETIKSIQARGSRASKALIARISTEVNSYQEAVRLKEIFNSELSLTEMSESKYKLIHTSLKISGIIYKIMKIAMMSNELKYPFLSTYKDYDSYLLPNINIVSITEGMQMLKLIDNFEITFHITYRKKVRKFTITHDNVDFLLQLIEIATGRLESDEPIKEGKFIESVSNYENLVPEHVTKELSILDALLGNTQSSSDEKSPLIIYIEDLPDTSLIKQKYIKEIENPVNSQLALRFNTILVQSLLNHNPFLSGLLEENPQVKIIYDLIKNIGIFKHDVIYIRNKDFDEVEYLKKRKKEEESNSELRELGNNIPNIFLEKLLESFLKDKSEEDKSKDEDEDEDEDDDDY